MKITISPAQAVLMLIDHNQHDEALVHRLSGILLSGVSDDEDIAFLNTQLNNEIFKDYRVRFDYKTISEDPVKRYFETHLAYHTLKSKLVNIDLDLLREQFSAIKHIAFKKIIECIKPSAINWLIGEINATLKGKIVGNEYSSAYNAIQQSNAYAAFTPEEKEKILLLIQSAMLSTFCGKLNFLPVDIYDTGLFTEKARGRLLHVSDQSYVRSHNMGLLKSYMPLSSSDIAYVDNPIDYLRPADQFQLVDPNTEWTSENFARLVHPFSSGISGTTLAHLRMLLYLQSQDQFNFDNLQLFSEYIKLFSSAMLYNAGGHSYYEFLSTLIQVPEILDEYEVFIPGVEQITINSLLLDENTQAFDQALRETIDYNRQIIRLKSVNVIISLKGGIAELNQQCLNYRDYLFKSVDQEINNLNLLDNSGRQLRAADLTPSLIDDFLKQHSISSGTRLLFEKLKVVLELMDILNGRVDFEATIRNFKQKFSSAIDVLQSNRDIAAIGILKALDKNLQRFNIRQSHGGLFSKDIQLKLTELEDDQHQKNVYQSSKKKAKH